MFMYLGIIIDTNHFRVRTGSRTFDAAKALKNLGADPLLVEDYLKGEDGLKQTDMSIDGVLTAEYITKEAVQGDSVVLTIDANLQQAAQEALKNNIEDIKMGKFGEARNVETGAAVVIDVKSGEILAMVSYPDFEPELFINGISQEKWDEYTQKRKKCINKQKYTKCLCTRFNI